MFMEGFEEKHTVFETCDGYPDNAHDFRIFVN